MVNELTITTQPERIQPELVPGGAVVRNPGAEVRQFRVDIPYNPETRDPVTYRSAIHIAFDGGLDDLVVGSRAMVTLWTPMEPVGIALIVHPTGTGEIQLDYTTLQNYPNWTTWVVVRHDPPNGGRKWLTLAFPENAGKIPAGTVLRASVTECNGVEYLVGSIYCRRVPDAPEITLPPITP